MSDTADNSAAEAAAPTKLARRAARLSAVQALYQMEIAGSSEEATIRQFTTGPARGQLDDGEIAIADADRVLFTELVRGTREKLAHLDTMIAEGLDDVWPLDRMEVLLRAILRCATYELLSVPATPARVVISEYVRVTDAFFDGKEPALVNGLLDRLARMVRPDEFSSERSGP